MSVVVVTGASSGIGRALALRAARAGYDVVAIGRNAAALDAVAQRVRDEPGRIVTAVFDVSDPANALAIVDLAREKFGRIDVLVNNAGQVAVGALSQQTDDALRAQFGTHVIGPVALVREALPLLRESRGIVFMLGSGVARVPVGGLGAYAPSKAATRSATSILRRELEPQGIAVTYVDPASSTPRSCRAPACRARPRTFSRRPKTSRAKSSSRCARGRACSTPCRGKPRSSRSPSCSRASPTSCSSATPRSSARKTSCPRPRWAPTCCKPRRATRPPKRSTPR